MAALSPTIIDRKSDLKDSTFLIRSKDMLLLQDTPVYRAFAFDENLRMPITSLRVLVVEDVPMMRDHITEILAETGLVSVIGWAADAQSAVNAVKEAHPHAVLLDISIPSSKEMRNGMDVLKWIKSAAPDIYVVMLTNMSDPIYREQCMRLGTFDFLDKSHEFNRLPEVIERILTLAASS